MAHNHAMKPYGDKEAYLSCHLRGGAVVEGDRKVRGFVGGSSWR